MQEAPRKAKSAVKDVGKYSDVGKDIGKAAGHQDKPRVQSNILAKMLEKLLGTRGGGESPSL